eukprot:GHVO01040984.1.p1 GENE.GHVO01040984.1~~GHVO01040984.1.p1  ORF type:complete len:255 (+),score=28.12 GHVO01040984.1:99-767(+)
MVGASASSGNDGMESAKDGADGLPAPVDSKNDSDSDTIKDTNSTDPNRICISNLGLSEVPTASCCSMSSGSEMANEPPKNTLPEMPPEESSVSEHSATPVGQFNIADLTRQPEFANLVSQIAAAMNEDAVKKAAEKAAEAIADEVEEPPKQDKTPGLIMALYHVVVIPATYAILEGMKTRYSYRRGSALLMADFIFAVLVSVVVYCSTSILGELVSSAIKNW